ncbi:unnamed protein product [Oikopleura dioica]|uniref:RRM domain-containing protein n=1 Tax=Oikopleura dioica TaxID=34765 RepID=E4XY48_OIKDI|nr:unnamed protein product [Oikopleura dioica]CBY36055.1 unnamed protein product [Oikopleura dioica]
MNILTKIRLINELNYKELRHGTNPENSWHMQYKDSAWIYAGNLSYKLTEGDILAVFSQFGEISNVNLVRDRETGTSKGFCFICYEDQRSTILAVDNFNGMELCNRPVRVDHVEEYKVPKIHDDMEPEIKKLKIEGVGPKTPEPSDSEEELPDIDAIRDHRKNKVKQEKEKRKEKEKRLQREFRCSLALFRAAEGGYYDDLTKDEEKTMKRKNKKKTRYEEENEVFEAFGGSAKCPW